MALQGQGVAPAVVIRICNRHNLYRNCIQQLHITMSSNGAERQNLGSILRPAQITDCEAKVAARAAGVAGGPPAGLTGATSQSASVQLRLGAQPPAGLGLGLGSDTRLGPGVRVTNVLV